jgi:hypothetical protein
MVYIFGIGVFANLSLVALPFDPVLIPISSAILGIGILPYKITIKKKIEKGSKELNTKLINTLENYFNNQLDTNISRIMSLIEPHKIILKK